MERISATSSRFTVEHVNGTQATRLTTGLWLATSGGGLHIFNALDENGLADRPDE